MKTAASIKTNPALFSVDMVRVILDRRKTQTRRVIVDRDGDRVVGQFWDHGAWHHVIRGREVWHVSGNDEFRAGPIRPPLGFVGEHLWVREPWLTHRGFDKQNATQIAEKCLDAGYESPWCPVQYLADGSRRNWGVDVCDATEPGRKRLGRFMPRYLSRIKLEVTGLRIERLNMISSADAVQEGFLPTMRNEAPAVTRFRDKWEELNGDRGFAWSVNPCVWVHEFKVLEVLR